MLAIEASFKMDNSETQAAFQSLREFQPEMEVDEPQSTPSSSHQKTSAEVLKQKPYNLRKDRKSEIDFSAFASASSKAIVSSSSASSLPTPTLAPPSPRSAAEEMREKKRKAGMEEEEEEESQSEEEREGGETDAEEFLQDSQEEEERNILRTQAAILRYKLCQVATRLPVYVWEPDKESKLVDIIAHAKELEKPFDLVASTSTTRSEYVRKRDAVFSKFQTLAWNLFNVGVGSMDFVGEGHSPLEALEAMTLKAAEIFSKINDVRKIETLGVSRLVIESGTNENAQQQILLLQEQLQKGKDLEAIQRSGRSNSRKWSQPTQSSSPTETVGKKKRGRSRSTESDRRFFRKGPRGNSRSPKEGNDKH
jgi:hypothetical protein